MSGPFRVRGEGISAQAGTANYIIARQLKNTRMLFKLADQEFGIFLTLVRHNQHFHI